MTGGAVIGGGIAGLATGLFGLQRRLDLTVYERSTRLSCQDNLLWLAPNGLHLMAALGLGDAVKAHGVAQEAMLFSTSHLRPLMGLDNQKLIQTNGYPIVAIKRGVLYRLLLDRFVALGGQVRYDHELTGVAQQDEEVHLTFGGSKTVRHAYLIGADGVGSAARRLLHPGSCVHYQGIRTYLGRSRTPVSQRFVGQTIETWGVGTRFVLTSLDGDTTYWSAIERPLAYEKNSAPLPDDIEARLATAFASYHADIRTVIADADRASIHRCNFGVVSQLPQYHHGRTCLIGDAAHGMPPNMGQGASLALEDAYVLTRGLATGADPAAVFVSFTKERRRRVHAMMQLANGMNTTFQPRGRIASTMRDWVMGTIPQFLSQRRMAKLYQVPFPIIPADALPGGHDS